MTQTTALYGPSEQSCSIASLAGSAKGCKKPEMDKFPSHQWVCRGCNHIFTVFTKTKEVAHAE